jgi:tripartite-type tricarboxylate transporter receptor subunit TctC
VPNLNPNAGYHPVKSFEPISLVGGITFVLIVHPSLPVRSVKELVALAKAKPRQLDYTSGGAGSSQHIAMELFQSATGTSFTHIPHRGATQATLDVMSGRVPVMFSALSVVLAQIETDKARAIAVASSQRSPLLKNVPTMIESGVPGFTFTSWNGLYAPHGTPKAIVDLLHAETAKAIADPGVRDTLVKLGMEPEGSAPAELASLTADGFARMAKLIKDTGLKLD